MKSKLMSFILSIACMFNVFNIGSITAFAEKEESAAVETQLLKSIGIIGENEEEAFDGVLMSRGDFAIFAGRLIGVDSESDAEAVRYFKDVAPNDRIAPFVNELYRNGIVSGTGENEFNPNEPIKPIDAAAILLRIANYHKIYPYPYNEAMAQNELLSEVSGNDMDFEEAAGMIYNALLMPMIQQKVNGISVDYESDEEYTVLYHYYNIYSVKGFLNGVGGLMLGGEKIRENKILIDTNEYECSEDVYKYLGYDVLGFIKEDKKDETYEAVCVLPYKNNNKVTEFKLQNIVGEVKEDLVISYCDDSSSRIKTITIPKNAVITKNGGLVNSSLHEAFSEEQGYVSVIESSNETVVKIMTYDTLMVNNVSENDMMIYTSFGKSLSIDEDKVSRFCVYLPDGTKGAVSDIKPGMLLTVFRSDAAVEIHTKSEAVTGKAMQISEDEITIDGYSYKIEPSYKEDCQKDCDIGQTVTFYLNAYGEISYVDKDSAEFTSNVGFLVNVGINEDLDNALRLKIFTSDGEMKTLYADEKLKIDGTKTTAEAAENILRNANGGYVSQLIAYEMKADGSILEIDTVAPGGGVNNGLTLKADFTGRNYNGNGLFLYTIMLNKNRTIFQVPPIADAENADEKFFKTVKSLKEKTAYNCAGYSLAGDSFYTDVVVIASEAAGSEFGDFDQLFMVDKVSEVYDGKTGETRTKVILGGSVSQNGGADMGLLEFFVSDDFEWVTDENRENYESGIQIGTDVNPDELGRGDLVRIVRNEDELLKIRRVFDYDDLSVDFTKIERYHENQTSLWLGRFSLEYAVKKDANICLLSRDKNYEPYEYVIFLNSGTVPVVVYDDSLKVNPIYLGSIDDVITAEQTDGEPSIVCPILYEGIPRAVFVYKNGLVR